MEAHTGCRGVDAKDMDFNNSPTLAFEEREAAPLPVTEALSGPVHSDIM